MAINEKSLFEKNMDSLRKEEVNEQLTKFGITLENSNDLSYISPFPFDDRLKLSEEQTEKINKLLVEMKRYSQEMERNGIALQTGFVESFGAQPMSKSQLEMLAGNVPIITLECNIEKIISVQKNIEDKYILDDENAIIVVHSDVPTGYIMIHERLVDGKLVEINRWSLNSYYFGNIHDVTVIEDLNLFQVQNNCGNFNALYNYKEGRFVVPQNTWGLVESGRGNSILKKYNGFLASFEISSDYEAGDVYAYDSPLTGERIVESFEVVDGNYYAILDIDGTIRGNKLFKGKSFSRITKIVDLDEYESLDAFKKEIKQLCNAKKQKRKYYYYQLLETRNAGSISPYLDGEVAKILKIELK